MDGESIKFSLFNKEIEELYFADLIRPDEGKCKISSLIHQKVLEDSLFPSESQSLQKIDISEFDLEKIVNEVIGKR